MDDARQARIGRNEALFREVNDAIARGQWPGDPEPIRFRCECARLDCNEVIELALGRYEDVRANPRRFVLRDGHQLPEAETVVERIGSYLVVEKRDEAGAVAGRLA